MATWASTGTVASINSILANGVIANGDTITIPAGTYTWASGISTISLGITFQGLGGTPNSGSGTKGSGTNAVTINCNAGSFSAMNIIANSTAPFRMTGITFHDTGANSNSATVNMSCTPGNKVWRFDNLNFQGPNECLFVEVDGFGPGLIDHCTLNSVGAAEMIHNLGEGSIPIGSQVGFKNSVTPGDAQVGLYIENCIAIGSPSSGTFTKIIEGYYGARNVIRFCTFQYSAIDQHGNSDFGSGGPITNEGARWWEFHDNFFQVGGANQSDYIVCRGGSGVIYNITSDNNNTGSGNVRMSEDSSAAYPVYCQVGRGYNQNLSPAYIWGIQSGIPATSDSSQVVLNRDFYVSTNQPSTMIRWELSTDNGSTTYSYVSFTYPYPLDSNGFPNPSGGGGTTPVTPGASGTSSSKSSAFAARSVVRPLNVNVRF